MDFEKVNIMIVNDNPNDLMAMEVILSSIDKNIVKASSGEEALKYLLSMEFAVIILDVMMPGMDGFETARIIHERQKTKHVPIIFVTAYARNEIDTMKGYELGAVDYLFTPVIPDVLRNKVNVFIDLFRTNKTIQQQAVNLARVNQRLYDAHQEMVIISKELREVSIRLESHANSQSQQFRDIEEKYRNIFENVSEGIFQIAPDGSILMANPAMFGLLGYDSFEQFKIAVPNIFQQLFVSPDQGEEFHQKIGANMAHEFEADIYTKDKNILCVSLSANIVHGKNSQVYYEGIILDISTSKKLAENLLEMEKAKALAKFAGETAHMILNPFQVIQSGLYLLGKIADTDKIQTVKTIKQMEDALQRATEFINELIDTTGADKLERR